MSIGSPVGLQPRDTVAEPMGVSPPRVPYPSTGRLVLRKGPLQAAVVMGRGRWGDSGSS